MSIIYTNLNEWREKGMSARTLIIAMGLAVIWPHPFANDTIGKEQEQSETSGEKIEVIGPPVPVESKFEDECWNSYRTYSFDESMYWRDRVNLRLDTVLLSSCALGGTIEGAHYSTGRNEIVLHHFMPAYREAGNLDLVEMLAALNSPARRAAFFAHELHHASNARYDKEGLSLQQYALLLKHDEVSSNVAALLMQRSVYLQTKDLSVFNGASSFYSDMIQKGLIKPEFGKMSFDEQNLIMNGTKDMWEEKYQETYDRDFMAQVSPYAEGKSLKEMMHGNDRKLKHVLSGYYSFNVDGRTIDFSQRMDNDVRSSRKVSSFVNATMKRQAWKERVYNMGQKTINAIKGLTSSALSQTQQYQKYSGR